MNKFQIELQNYVQTDIEYVKSEEKMGKGMTGTRSGKCL